MITGWFALVLESVQFSPSAIAALHKKIKKFFRDDDNEKNTYILEKRNKHLLVLVFTFHLNHLLCSGCILLNVYARYFEKEAHVQYIIMRFVPA